MAEKFKKDYPRIRAYAPERWVVLRYYHLMMLRDEVEQFSQMRQQKYPDGVFLSADAYGYSGKQYPSSVTTYPSPLAAGAAKNHGSAYFRVPWPEDNALPEPIRRLGFYDTPDNPDPFLFHRLGRRIQISWPSERRKSKPTITVAAKETVDGEKTGGYVDLISSQLKISALFDSRDPDTIQFLNEIEQMLIDMTTCDFATYDLYSGVLINPKRHDKSQRYSAGVIRYAALHNRIYLGTFKKKGAPIELMGVKPELRAAIRAGAGLPIG
jgi:hypothetical protein